MAFSWPLGQDAYHFSRLRYCEDALKHMQATIADLKTQGQYCGHLPTSAHSIHGDEQLRGNETEEQCSGRASISRPADSGTKSAPIVVLREINAQVSKGYRRLLQHANLDLVELGVIDEHIAQGLIEM